MKIIRNRLWGLALLLLLHSISFGQNFIYNGGFESGNAQVAGQTSNKHLTVDYLDHWERAKGVSTASTNANGYNLRKYHSPDWSFGTTVSQLTSAPQCTFSTFAPDEGSGMCGFQIMELIQQKFDRSGLQSAMANAIDQTVTVSFRVRRASSFAGDVSLKVYFAKKRLKYKSNKWWKNGFYQLDGNSNFFVAALVTNLNSPFSQNEWRTYSVNIPYSAIEDYKWFGIGLERPVSPTLLAGDHCHSGYLRIDQVEMKLACEVDCYNSFGMPAVQVFGNQIFSTGYFRMTNLSDVTGLTLKVYTLGGQLAYSNSAYCPNGFVNDLNWDGKNLNNVHLANATYKYVIEASNSCYVKTFTGTIAKVQDYTGPVTANFSAICPNGTNLTPIPCCLSDFYINSEILVGLGYSQYIVQNNIWACTALPNSNDQVIIASDAKVLFQAGDQVTLAEGFNTDPGAVFVAQVVPCFQKCGGNNAISVHEVAEEALHPDAKRALSVAPNPTTGRCRLLGDYPESESVTLTISDLQGRTIFKRQQNGLQEIEIDLSMHPKGIYLLRVDTPTDKQSRKIILQ